MKRTETLQAFSINNYCTLSASPQCLFIVVFGVVNLLDFIALLMQRIELLKPATTLWQFWELTNNKEFYS